MRYKSGSRAGPRRDGGSRVPGATAAPARPHPHPHPRFRGLLPPPPSPLLQSGLSVLSWLFGRMAWDLVLQGLYPAVYLGFYYAMTVFDTAFGLYYLILVFIAWWVGAGV